MVKNFIQIKISAIRPTRITIEFFGQVQEAGSKENCAQRTQETRSGKIGSTRMLGVFSRKNMLGSSLQGFAVMVIRGSMLTNPVCGQKYQALLNCVATIDKFIVTALERRQRGDKGLS